MESSGVAPYPLALVICDAVYRDPYTGKCTIIGTFSAIGGPEPPLRHPVLCAYVAMTEGRGQVDVKLRLIDSAEEREPVIEFSDTVEFEDPRMVAEISFAANDVIFPEYGEYSAQIFANEEFLIERRILVAPGPPGEDQFEG